LISEFCKAAPSCSRHVREISYLEVTMQGKVISMPKTFTLMGAHCLSQCNNESQCQIAGQSMTTAFLSTVQMQLKIPATLTTMFLKRTENGCSCALKGLKVSIYKVNARWRTLEWLWNGSDKKNRSTRRIKTACITYRFSSTNPIRTCLELSPDLRD
jgi:hypothetical protein